VAVRAMEPRACFLGFGAGNVGNQALTEGRSGVFVAAATLEASREWLACRRKRGTEEFQSTDGHTNAFAPEGT
jgi:hypothetical protein